MTSNGDTVFTTVDVRGHLLPGMWQYLLPEGVQWLALPRELPADCDRCPMVARGEFAADCQCCTCYPQIPNFLVGLALKDPVSRPAMRRVVEAGGALPREMVAPPAVFARSVRLVSSGRFGQQRDPICPFFDGRTTHCAVYPYRNSVCSTFSCHHDHGETGEAFWERLQQLVGHLEQQIAQWAMDRLGFDHDRYVDILSGLADRVGACSDPDTGLWSEDARCALWGEHLGSEVAFFERCAELVLAHRGDLYDIACDTPLRQPVAFERAVRDGLPADLRDHVPAVAEHDLAAEPIPSLNYKLELAGRSLWQLPFGEGTWVLASGVDLAAFDEPERSALGLFASPRAVDGDLLDCAKIASLTHPRESLAVWLRRGVLVRERC